MLCSSTSTKSKLTLDEYFNYTHFPSFSLSPDGQQLLVHIRRLTWDSNNYENSLWLYETQGRRKKLITKKLSQEFKPQWSPSGNWIVLRQTENSMTNNQHTHYHYRRLSESDEKIEQYIYFYCVLSEQLLSVSFGTEILSALTWSSNDSSLYFATVRPSSTKEDEDLDEAEWKDVIQYRKRKSPIDSTIYRIDIDRKNRTLVAKRNILKNVSFLIGQLLFSSVEQKLVFTSVGGILENVKDFEIYSIDLRNLSSLSRITNNEIIEDNLQLSSDGKYVLFRQIGQILAKGNFNITQQHLYSVDLTNGQIERLARNFNGNIVEYATRSDGVYILGQLGTNVHIYTQQSPERYSVLQHGWNGTYESITLSSNQNGSLAFLYSSYRQPKEIYFIRNLNKLESAKAITNENKLLTQINLPQNKVYKWTSDVDDRAIEGILHYPPEKFESKNLPLLVLLHGGPYAASINQFDGSAASLTLLAASEGWLVLEPNYRGSTGYGDQFLNEIRYYPLSLPGRDILSGVDRLIKDGIADPNSLAVGGYSYGGFLTNWLITQTTRFKAALTGAGSIEHVSTWGTMDLPASISYLFGGFPWEVPHIYQAESPIYHLAKVRTPTHIITGTDDTQIPADQSYILERGLHYLGVPVKLLLFPNEGHSPWINPWHLKIKVREELKWLQTYGRKSLTTTII
ncbi:unnamed protein product [Rotaria sp. Silwood1]|nr:unnamed protein product [Rotaria sp. Silwood1]